MREAVLTKTLQALALFAFSSSGTFLPKLLLWHAERKDRQARERAGLESESANPHAEIKLGELASVGLSLGNALAGGIMLATGMAHILGDAIKVSIRTSPDAATDEDAMETAIYLPIVYCLIGILVPFFLEKSGLLIWLLRSGSCFKSHYIFLHQIGLVKLDIPDEDSEAKTDHGHSHSHSQDHETNHTLDSAHINGKGDQHTQKQNRTMKNSGDFTADETTPLTGGVLGHSPDEDSDLFGHLAEYNTMRPNSNAQQQATEFFHHGYGHAPPIPLSMLDRSRSFGHYGGRDPRSLAPVALVSFPQQAADGNGGVENCRSKCVVPGFTSLRLQGRLDMFKAMGSAPGRTLAYAPLIYAPEDVASTPPYMLESDLGNNEHKPVLSPRSVSEMRKRSIEESSNGASRQHGTRFSFGALDDEQSSTGAANNTMQRLRLQTHDTEPHEHPEKHSHMFFATFLMFLVLSIHSLIVGLTIGSISISELRSQENAFIAVLIHKLFESLALGVSCAQHPITTAVKLELVAYNLAAPLGIMLGIIAENYDILQGDSEVIMLGVASGSFIYIALVEVLAEEFEDEEYRILKFAAFLTGTSLMAYLARVA